MSESATTLVDVRVFGSNGYLFCSILTAPESIMMRLSARVAAELAEAIAERGLEWALTLCVCMSVWECVCVCVCVYVFITVYTLR
jgi:hypothetical protein